MQVPNVISVDRLSLDFRPQSWPLALERRAEIEAHFQKVRQQRPEIWNGRVLLMHEHRFNRRALEGSFLETDFASFLAWRDFGFPEAGVINCFSMGALRTSDGAWLLGVMGDHTSAAGKIYFPAGTPDPSDIVDGAVDLAGSVIREVGEETGLGTADFVERNGWACVIDGPRIALMKVLQAHEPADVLRKRIRDYLGRETMPELADIHIVRSRSDYDPMMPRFVTAFLDHSGIPSTHGVD